MFAHRIKAQVRPNQPLTLPLPPDIPAGEVEVIVLYPQATIQPGTFSSLREFSAWIKKQAPSQRSREVMDGQLEEERESWG